MAQVNPLTREILVKLVYYGPGLGGKTTSLQKIHGASPPETRGQIVSLATPVDRTLYFDFLPLRATTIRGHHVRLQLFTVPGQVYFNATRKLVLTGADGVVFVADSQRARLDANLESLENLAANLEEQGRSIEEMPLIFQYNKRDLPDVMEVFDMDEVLNALASPVFETSAVEGLGVMDALDALVQAVLDDLERRNILGEPGAPAEEPAFSLAEDAFAEQVEKQSEKMWQSAGPSSSPGSNADISSTASAVDFGAPEPRDETVETIAPAEGGLVRGEPTRPGSDVTGLGDVVMPGPARLPTTGERSEGVSSPSRRAPLFGGAAAGGPSWAPLFREQAEAMRTIEAFLGDGAVKDAILECDRLARDLLDAAGRQAGLSGPSIEPALVVPLLGLEGDRWLSFARLVRRARSGGPLDPVDGLQALGILIEVRLRRDRLLG